MPYEWDERKRKINLAKHGVDFETIHEFDWDTAAGYPDDREDYGELREMALGFIGVTLFHVSYVDAGGEVARIISLRKATKKEITFYVQYARSMEGGAEGG